MNKTLRLLLCFFFLLAAFSCGQKAEEANSDVKREVSPELKKLRKEIKKTIDANKGDSSKDPNHGYKVIGLDFDNKFVKIDYEVDKTLHIDSLVNYKDIYDEIFYYCLIREFMANGEFLTNLINAKVNILWKVTSTESKTEISHIITCGKLSKLLRNAYPPVELAKLQLRAVTAVGSAGLPIQRDASTISQACLFNGKNVVYENTVLEDEVCDLSRKEIREQLLKIIKPGMIQNIQNDKTTRAAIEPMFDLCITAKANMVYNYHGNKSGRSITVTFTPSEMESIIKKK